MIASLLSEPRALSACEEADRARLEAQVKNSLATAKRHTDEYHRAKQQARLGLEELRDGRLWESSHPRDWEGYCLDTFGLTNREVDRLIAAAGVIRDLQGEKGPIGPLDETGTIVPLSDGAARELVGETRDMRIKIYNEVLAGGFKPTAKLLKRVKEKLKDKSELDEIDRITINAHDAAMCAAGERQAKLANMTRREREAKALKDFQRELKKLAALLSGLPRLRQEMIVQYLDIEGTIALLDTDLDKEEQTA